MKEIKIKDKLYVIKSCPCCGHQPQEEIDYLHPTFRGFEVYKDFEKKENFDYYNGKDDKFDKVHEIVSLITEGGSGISLSGSSI